MQLSPAIEDRVRIATPEGVTLELTLAGLASRAMAGIIDLVLVIAVWFFVFLFFAALFLGVSDFAAAALSITSLLLLVLVAPAAFEAWMRGQTPGKRLVGLRTVSMNGQSVSLGTALIRNLFRMVDFLPAAYAAGMVSIATTELNQRIGDVVAGTIVVRDRELGGTLAYLESVRLPESRPWDVTRITDEEVAVVRRYFERRPAMSEDARRRLAAKLARHLAPRVMITDQPASDEAFLLRLLAEKLQRAARR